MLWPSHSMHKTNKYGDKGYPCQTSFASLNFSIGTPFHMTCIVEEEIVDMITIRKKSSIPTCFNYSSMNSQ